MSFIQNIWYVAAWSSEIQPGQIRAVTVADQAVVLFRREDAKIVALDDRCSHRCAPLSEGRIQGSRLRCWYHGLLFDENGTCVEMPGQQVVASGFDVRAYPVVERFGCVWIWLGSKEDADPALIPNTGIGEGATPFKEGVLDYAADYQLINDNLCDFSHVAYVHEKTLARSNDEWSQTRPTITNIDTGVRVTRWIEGAGALPLPGVPEKIDLWMTYDYVLPGLLLMQIEYHPLGTAAAQDFAPSTSLDGVIYAMRTAQAATPTSTGKSRYHYGIALPVNPGPGSLEATFQMTAYAFLEDKHIIEAQQASLDRNPVAQLRNTVHDVALTRIRRMINNRINAEQQRGKLAREQIGVLAEAPS